MLQFVEFALGRIREVRTDADIVAILGFLADHLDYRSAYLLDFPDDARAPVRLWDSHAERSEWWHKSTNNGLHPNSQDREVKFTGPGAQEVVMTPAQAIYPLAVQYDFAVATVVPIVFDREVAGVASFSGDIELTPQLASSLEITCYALLSQARILANVQPSSTVRLTPREREVIELSSQGLTSEGVASTLGMSPRTVNQHLDHISLKLQTKNRVHAVAEAIRRRLI